MARNTKEIKLISTLCVTASLPLKKKKKQNKNTHNKKNQPQVNQKQALLVFLNSENSNEIIFPNVKNNSGVSEKQLGIPK